MTRSLVSLADFPALQMARYVSKRIVVATTGLSNATIDRRVKDGTFPPPVKISKNRVAWRETDLSEWLDDPVGWSTRDA